MSSLTDKWRGKKEDGATKKALGWQPSEGWVHSPQFLLKSYPKADLEGRLPRIGPTFYQDAYQKKRLAMSLRVPQRDHSYNRRTYPTAKRH